MVDVDFFRGDGDGEVYTPDSIIRAEWTNGDYVTLHIQTWAEYNDGKDGEKYVMQPGEVRNFCLDRRIVMDTIEELISLLTISMTATTVVHTSYGCGCCCHTDTTTLSVAGYPGSKFTMNVTVKYQRYADDHRDGDPSVRTEVYETAGDLWMEHPTFKTESITGFLSSLGVYEMSG